MSVGICVKTLKHRFWSPNRISTDNKNWSMFACLLLLSGDIQSNPGPANVSHIYPCGLCEMPVTWEHLDGIACDGCSIWHHRSCIELCSADYDLLARHSHIQWLCCKCESINIDCFTFRSLELYTSNVYNPLSYIDESIDSVSSSASFRPLHTSSPSDKNSSSTRKSRLSSSDSHTNVSSLYDVSAKRNFRIMNVNCRSVRSNNSEFQTALNYIKPDVVFGTESWLRGVKPGKPDSADAIKSSEVFPSHYNAFRNDRSSLGGGVFILVHKDLVALEKTEFVTDCEITWTNLKLKDRKNLMVASFYMPHRDMKDIQELRRSLELVTAGKDSQILLAGDFNCPDINWQTLTVKSNAQDKEIQQALIDISIDFNLTQVHEKPTREDNLLDLVFTTNPSLVKPSSNAPGISDHDIVVVDSDTKPFYSKQKPRKCFLFSKVNWDELKVKISGISKNITEMYEFGKSIHELWDTFKTDLMQTINENVPSKMFRSNTSTPWIRGKAKRVLRRKARLYKRAKKTKNWTRYRKFQCESKRELRKAEWSYINNKINDGLKHNN